MTGPLRKAAETFLAEADWLSDIDAPMVALLRSCADQLDSEWNTAVATAYRQTFNHLSRRNRPGPDKQPTKDDSDGSLQALLE